VQLEESTLDTLLVAANGDMRKSVTFLQSCHQLTFGNGAISPEMVIDVSGKVPTNIMAQLWTAAAGFSFEALQVVVQDIVYQGFPMGSILSQLYDDLIDKEGISDLSKALICEKIAEVRLVSVPHIVCTHELIGWMNEC
jgi:replication factor C subunit 2/4